MAKNGTMATPYLHPKSGVFYIRRQIPADVRSAFGYVMHQASLGTKSPAEAKVLFARASLALDERIAAARGAATAMRDERTIDTDRADALVRTFLDEYVRDGVADSAASTSRGAKLVGEVEAIGFMTGHVGGRTGDDGEDREPTEMLRDLFAREPMGVWAFLLKPHVRDLVARLGLPADLPPDGMTALVQAMARALPSYRIPGSQARNQRADELGHGRRRRDGSPSRLRPTLKLGKLFDEWKAKREPRPQSAHEFKGYVDDFIAFVGDIPVGRIERDDLFDYRDEAACLPAAMSRADRALPFPERAAKFVGLSVDRISPSSVKKRVGAIQALLAFAYGQRWIATDVGAKTPIDGYAKGKTDRRTFRDDELTRLFSSPLFLAPSTWRVGGEVADSTLYWLFLLGLTAGARIEEPGQAMLADCGQDTGIGYIDITDYVDHGDDVDDDLAKSVKTDESRRLLPIHSRLIECGFQKYVDALRAAGARHLFPELRANQFEKRTQQASRRANRVIDKQASDDPRLVFHSFRHTFKSLGRDSGVQKSVLDQICGHAGLDVGDRYGRGARLRTIHAQLMTIDFSVLPWDDIVAASAAIDWADVARKLMAKRVRKGTSNSDVGDQAG